MNRAFVALSALLAASGIATAINGILAGYADKIGIGIVLIFGGIVFALLSIASARSG